LDACSRWRALVPGLVSWILWIRLRGSGMWARTIKFSDLERKMKWHGVEKPILLFATWTPCRVLVAKLCHGVTGRKSR
jgi:hypothetical protein